MLNTKPQENIYPRSLENIKAIFLYYFKDIPHSEIDEFSKHIYDRRGLSLNEIKTIASTCINNKSFFEKHHFYRVGSLSNMFSYTRDALMVENEEIKGSQNRIQITLKLRTIIVKKINENL